MADPAHDLGPLLDELTLDDKVRVLTGRDFWSTHALPAIGLRSMTLSDGPSGVRGSVWDERDPSLNLPSATALASSWDLEVAHRYGEVCALEARRKGVDVVLGPTINLHRSPLGGRHFEALSEDPVLTAQLAAAYVRGVQENGVGATPKHYVANDFETERFTVDVIVGERALRELYLLPFEDAVVDAHAWLVMSAYNSINGATATENELLKNPLNDEWGFDGVVVSDWTAVRSLGSANHHQDLVMPGPDGPWGQALVDAVRSGKIDESVVDRKVIRILRLAARVGALGTDPATTTDVDAVAFARAAAVEGTVLVSNQGELPWAASSLSRIAVIGHNARQARTQGGGSATVIPESVVSPLDGIRAAFPGAEVTYSVGAVVQQGVAAFPLESMTNPVTGQPGARIRFLGRDGEEIFAENRFSSTLVYLGGDAPTARAETFEFSTRYVPEKTGMVRLGYAAVGRGRIFVDGTLVHEELSVPVGTDPGAGVLGAPSVSAPVEVVVGRPIDVRVEIEPEEAKHGLVGALAVTVGLDVVPHDPRALIDDAVDAARGADVAVVVVGTNAQVESEGWDRTSLALPGYQDDLVTAVAAANPRTAVVVNSGSPVLLPWRDDVAAILVTYFGGQEYGHALADVLVGAVEPGGRLPTTWPRAEADVPVLDVTPTHGVLEYEEGVHIGYRAWLRSDRQPAFEFGHGLGYTEWEISDLRVRDASSDRRRVSVVLRNVGDRPGKHVVQVYAERPDSMVDRPVRWLIGFAATRLDPGESRTVEVRLHRHAFEYWDGRWVTEPGRFTVRAGTSVLDLPLETPVELA